MSHRYHFERRSNLLPAVEPYKDFEEPVKEAYFPKLELLSKYSDFSSRPANIMLKVCNSFTNEMAKMSSSF